MRAPLWCAIALSERIHPARAVVPPPRLRAKWSVFSAPLRTTLGGSGWGSARRCWEVKSLQNPAKVGGFSKLTSAHGDSGFSWCLGKRVRFFLGRVYLARRPVFAGLES